MKNYFMFFLIATIISCSQNFLEVEEEEPYYLKNLDGSIVQSVPAKLLPVIETDLKNRGKTKEAKNLKNGYDYKTGQIINDTTQDSTEIASAQPWNRTFLKYRAHVQRTGWLNYVHDLEVAGTTGQSKRLEAFAITHDSPYPDIETPNLNYKSHVRWDGWQ